jgi:hypothetical protein
MPGGGGTGGLAQDRTRECTSRWFALRLPDAFGGQGLMDQVGLCAPGPRAFTHVLCSAVHDGCSEAQERLGTPATMTRLQLSIGPSSNTADPPLPVDLGLSLQG